MLAAIRSLRDAKGYPPSIREIGDAIGLASTSTTHHHLSALAALGIVRWEPGVNRSIAIVGED